MRKEIRNLVVVLGLIGLVGLLATLNAGSRQQPGSSPLFYGVRDLALYGGLVAFASAQSILTARTLKLLRRPAAENAGPVSPGGATTNVLLDVLWTLMPAVLVIGIGVYTLWWR
jgi:hypothetical protein